MASIVVSGDTSGAVTITAPAIAGTTTLTLPTTSGTIVTTGGASSLTTSGNLTFTGTGNRITGDFSNATIANRVMFQNSVTDTNTTVGIIPNGTAISSFITAYNSSDPTNTSFTQMGMFGTESRITSGITGTGTYRNLTFYTGGSERLRIDTSGNVGIGTSSPNAILEANKTITFSDVNTFGQLVVKTASGANGKLLNIGVDDTNSLSFIQSINRGSDYMPLVLQRYGGNVGIGTNGLSILALLHLAQTGGARQRFQNTGTRQWSIGNNGSDFTFVDETGTSERMRITSGGDLLVGTTTSGGRITAAINTGFVQQLRSDGNGADYIEFYNAATPVVVGSITRVGGTNVAYNTSSDYRLKENILPMTGALDKVSQLKPCTYTWKADGSAGEGFIAHELQAVVPDAVTGEKDAVNEDGSIKPQGIDTSFLVATLTAAIQEQQQIINDLKARIETLENK